MLFRSHMETDLLNSIGEVRPGEGEVLQSTSQTPVGNRISHRITQISGQLRLIVDRSGAGLAISHPSPLQDIECLLLTAAGAGEDQTGEAQ